MNNKNPLLNNYSLPMFEDIKPEHIEPAVLSLVKEARDKFYNLENSCEPTWQSLFEPLCEIDNMIHHCWGPITHLQSVKNSEEFREAYQKVLGIVVSFSLECNQSRKLYESFLALRDKEAENSLDEAQKRALNQRIQYAELSGVGLEGSARERFNEISKELSELENTFSNNVLDATKEYYFIIKDKNDLKGVSDSFYMMTAANYNNIIKSDVKASKDNGPWLINLDPTVYVPFMESCENSSLREMLYKKFITRASYGEYDNSKNIKRILQLRLEKAKILGYSSFAELSLARKMAKRKEAVYRLADELLKPSWQKGIEELVEIKNYAKDSGFTKELKNWDIPFWAKRLQEVKFSYKEEELKAYFPLPYVLDGLFSLVSKLFDIKVIEKTTDKPQIWHKDVRFYEVFNKQGMHLASFYLDPFSRPENKRGGAWMDTCVLRHRNKEGKIVLPVAYLVCNFTPPLSDTPSLLTFREVETLFHEFGHGLQHMLTEVDYIDVSGINGIEWDAVELPSQFMENWCYHKETLLGLAKHYKTKEVLPENFYHKIVASKNHLAALAMLRQLQFGLLDMKIHDNFDPFADHCVFSLQKEVAQKTSILAPLEEDRFLCAFNHIFSGGYAAGYYSYKWAEVLSADAFSAFEEVGLENTPKLKEVGERFKKTILACGGGKDPMDVFRDFRGREPETKALLKHSGLC